MAVDIKPKAIALLDQRDQSAGLPNVQVKPILQPAYPVGWFMSWAAIIHIAQCRVPFCNMGYPPSAAPVGSASHNRASIWPGPGYGGRIGAPDTIPLPVLDTLL